MCSPGRKRKPSVTTEHLQRASGLFQPEPEEDIPVRSASSSSKKLFQAESGDSSTEDGSSCSQEETTPTTFNFGWQQMHKAALARFTEDVSKAGRPPAKKRHYNNENRKTMASYKRSGTKQRENGVSTSRISEVLSQDTCLCRWFLKTVMFCRLAY